MKAEYKGPWLKALRSGRYEQALGELRMVPPNDDKPKHCCLGVLAEINDLLKADTEAGYERALCLTPTGRLANTSGDGLLVPSVLKLVGLTKPQQADLAEMNDNGKDFCEIANYIEENL